jgi:hypothetical protein
VAGAKFSIFSADTVMNGKTLWLYEKLDTRKRWQKKLPQ